MHTKRYHIIIDVSGVSSEILNDGEGLKKFLMDLPPLIGMHVLADSLISQGIPENPGLSGFVLIDYSHISIHTFTKYNEALVDIFSCKPYDQQTAVEAALKYFKIPQQAARVKEVFWG